ncbi:SDR family oxidoreductase [bacterium 210820-DFI.6.37]|nr:SDR family oxidoreductase [bacterium 210820-DFI.6.37]
MYDFIKMEKKHVLITGGSSGIGQQTAILLSKLGAKVAIVGRREEALKETMTKLTGKDHTMHVIDVGIVDQLEPKIVDIVKDTGAFDGFVHSAGIVKNLPIKNYKFEQLQKIMNVNFAAYFEIVRILSKKGRFNSGMSIVGVSSVAATQGATAQAAYGASKAAMNGAMRCLAKELCDKGIRVNTVLPAATETAMYLDYMTMKAQMKNTEVQLSTNPRQYLGMNSPEDVANAIVFLLSSASSKITGVQLPVDGGYASC